MTTLSLPPTGPLIASEEDGRDIIGDAFGQGADLILIPVSRLSPEFFHLASGLAGAILQKFSTYQLPVAIVGDISAFTSRSAPLADFVRESNRRGQVRFVASEAEL